MKEVMKRISDTRCSTTGIPTIAISRTSWTCISTCLWNTWGAAKFITTAAPMKKTTYLEISLRSVKLTLGTARYQTIAVQIET